MVSLCNLGCPGTHCVDQAGLEHFNLSASASLMLRLKACATTARTDFFFFFFLENTFLSFSLSLSSFLPSFLSFYSFFLSFFFFFFRNLPKVKGVLHNCLSSALILFKKKQTKKKTKTVCMYVYLEEILIH